MFSHIVLEAILKTHLLDCIPEEYWLDLRAKESEVYTYLWRAYLTRHALGLHGRPATQVGVVLRESAVRYCAEAGLSGNDDLRDVLEALCDRFAICARRNSWFHPPPKSWPPLWHIWQGALVAAAILNNASVAERILTHPRRGAVGIVEGGGQGTFFNNPSQVAIYFGSRDVVEVFARLARREREKFDHHTIVEECAYRRSPQNLMALWDVVPVDLDEEPVLADITEMALSKMIMTDSPDMVEVYRKLACESLGLSAPVPLKDMPEQERKEMILDQDMPYDYKDDIDSVVSLGHARMVEFLLETVLPSRYGHQNGLVAVAARGFHTEAVRYLLRFGADAKKGEALAEAAGAGSLDICRMLIENGASPQLGDPLPIVRAVKIEHIGIFDMLWENGALTEEAKRQALGVARELGLGSMVSLLESRVPKSAVGQRSVRPRRGRGG